MLSGYGCNMLHVLYDDTNETTATCVFLIFEKGYEFQTPYLCDTPFSLENIC